MNQAIREIRKMLNKDGERLFTEKDLDTVQRFMNTLYGKTPEASTVFRSVIFIVFAALRDKDESLQVRDQ